MPRQPRKRSKSNVYHIMLRGNNRQSIFECDNDYLHFIELLRQYKKKCGYKVYAYCLMGNHAHLLMGFPEEDVSICMKKINVSYSYYFNYKNMRSGHLFQDRFRSEAVEDDAYFIGVARYIHRNPVKANICSDLKDYRWSSYLEYAKACGQVINIKPVTYLTDIDMILSMQGRDEFIRFNTTSNDDEYLELNNSGIVSISDLDARALMKASFGFETVASVQAMAKEKQQEVVSMLLNAGANVSQISRITGISRATITKYIRW